MEKKDSNRIFFRIFANSNNTYFDYINDEKTHTFYCNYMLYADGRLWSETGRGG